MAFNTETPKVKLRRWITDSSKTATLLVRLPEYGIDLHVNLFVMTQTLKPKNCLHVRFENEEVFLEHSSAVDFVEPYSHRFDCARALSRLVEGDEFATKIAKPLVEQLRLMGVVD